MLSYTRIAASHSLQCGLLHSDSRSANQPIRECLYFVELLQEVVVTYSVLS